MTAKTFTAPFVQTVNNPTGQILPADASGLKTIWTAGSADGVLYTLFASSTDGTDRSVVVTVNIGGAGTDIQVATILVPLNSGNTTAVLPCNILNSTALGPYLRYDAYGNRCWTFQAGSTFKVNSTTTVTTAKALSFTGDGGNY
jgi:hypothetical protein